MKRSDTGEQGTGRNKYVRDTTVSESSRYSRAETFRTGSRYPDKIRAASNAAKAAGEQALRQARREDAKVDEVRRRGGLKEYETMDIAKAIAEERARQAEARAAQAEARAVQAETRAAQAEEQDRHDEAGIGKKPWRWQNVVLSVLAGLLIASYVTGAVFFAGHFYPGTMIYDINCSAKSTDWTKTQIQNKIAGYTLTLEERENRTEVIHADQVGMRYEDLGAVEDRMSKQYSLLWPLMMLIRRNAQTAVSSVYDWESIDDALQTLGCVAPENQIPPENAYVGEGEDGFVVVPEVMGTTLRYDVLRTTVQEALDAGKTSVSLEENECYTLPSVYSDDEGLLEDVGKRNALLGADIVIDFSDRTETIGTEKIMEFIVRDPDGSYRIDPDMVWDYTAQLAEKYDTYGGTRTFRTSIGTTETLYGGDYGWAIEQNETAQMLLDAIREKKEETVEPIYAYTAMSRSTNDIGNTYVEVCISRQEMWCYKDGVLVTDTPVVTGNPNRGNATPSGGVWSIDGKMEKFVLVGEGYRAPVDYWMPFNGNIGIHDLQTRYWFGSTIYQSNGSHGCVNTPLDAVSKIYDAVSVGTPVIVYEGEGTTEYGASAWR